MSCRSKGLNNYISLQQYINDNQMHFELSIMQNIYIDYENAYYFKILFISMALRQ